MSSPGAAPTEDGRSSPADPTRPEVPAFEVDGVTYRWDDVHAHAARTGERAILKAQVRRALAAEQLASEDGSDVDPRALRAAEADFRRARRLHAAEDLERWLGERGLTVRDWRRHVRAEFLRACRAGELDGAIAAPPLEPEEVERALSVWGRCTGAVATWARTHAARVASAHAVCDQEARPYPEPGDEAALNGLAERFAAAAASRERIDALVASRSLSWLMLECEVAVFRDDDVAKEALACIRDDGWTLAQAASAGGTRVRRRRLWVEDVDEQIGHHLIRARDDELIGPFALASGPALVQVHRKHEPSAHDDEVRARAARELVAVTSSREVDDRVRWLSRIF